MVKFLTNKEMTHHRTTLKHQLSVRFAYVLLVPSHHVHLFLHKLYQSIQMILCPDLFTSLYI